MAADENPTTDLRELMRQIQQALVGVDAVQKDFSQEGKALATCFLNLVHALLDTQTLDRQALFENMHYAVESYLKSGDALAAHHVCQLYTQLLYDMECRK